MQYLQNEISIKYRYDAAEKAIITKFLNLIKKIKQMENSHNDLLKILCIDRIVIKDKVTFDSCIIQGVQVTYWMDDDIDIEERINTIFDILFEDVLKTRSINQSG